ncbi:WG repeat-containing protein [Bordetella genomosp. 5]|nr:WG repeat-containing protein [Bordetella genomosp. 5]
MGNRAWLYLQSDSTEDTPPTEVASANGNLPTLWQVLLASGAEAVPVDAQDIMDEGGAAGVASDARAAYDRLGELAAFLSRHAGREDAPLCLQLDAAVRYLAGLIDEHDETEALRFSANLNELSWLHGDGAHAYAAHVNRTSNALWAALQRGMGADDVAGVCALLCVQDADDDAGWAWTFGFGGLSHPYFHEQEPVRSVSFEDFDAEDGQEEGEWLGGGRYTFCVDGRWGLRALDDDADAESEDECWRILMQPEWDAIWSGDATDKGVLWMRREGLIGLLHADDQRGRVLIEPRFDAVWDFSEDIASVESGGKVGLVAADGRVVMEPVLDEAWRCAQGLVIALVGDLMGYVGKDGQWAITPRFEDVGSFQPGGLAPAYENEAWGLIDRQGAWVVAPTWQEIFWEEELHAYVVQRDALNGVVDAAGRLVLDACHVGVSALDTETDLAEQWDRGVMRINVLTTDERRGVVDGAGKVLVPLVYADVGEVTWLPSRLPGVPEPAPSGQAARYVRVLAAAAGDDMAGSEGVYDCTQGREVLPCAYVLTFGLAWNDGYGWLVLQAPDDACAHSEDGLLVGLAHPDGTWLHAPVYAWIGAPASLQTAAGIYNGPPALVRRWNEGLPVAAVRGDTGEQVLLHPDGRETAA